MFRCGLVYSANVHLVVGIWEILLQMVLLRMFLCVPFVEHMHISLMGGYKHRSGIDLAVAVFFFSRQLFFQNKLTFSFYFYIDFKDNLLVMLAQ